MKRLITLSIILSSTFYAYAQDVEKSVTLDEVTVKAAKVVNKPDGMILYPTDAQKTASNNGYSILEKLSLANIRVDNINHSITAIDNRGGVQIRINGIIVGKQEMLALNPKDIAKIEFINNPGVRYGEALPVSLTLLHEETRVAIPSVRTSLRRLPIYKATAWCIGNGTTGRANGHCRMM